MTRQVNLELQVGRVVSHPSPLLTLQSKRVERSRMCLGHDVEEIHVLVRKRRAAQSIVQVIGIKIVD